MYAYILDSEIHNTCIYNSTTEVLEDHIESSLKCIMAYFS